MALKSSYLFCNTRTLIMFHCFDFRPNPEYTDTLDLLQKLLLLEFEASKSSFVVVNWHLTNYKTNLCPNRFLTFQPSTSFSSMNSFTVSSSFLSNIFNFSEWKMAKIVGRPCFWLETWILLMLIEVSFFKRLWYIIPVWFLETFT